MPATKSPGVESKSSTATIHAKAIELGKHVLEMTTAAGSGHPSSALALSHIVIDLMYRRMRYDLADPWSLDNDRLVLSIGHAVPIVYAAYADLGGVVGKSKADARPLRLNDLKSLRELDSVLDGHPNPAEGFPFFDAATGSLGQGLSVAAGLAVAAKMDRCPRKVYCIVGDGESREGQVWEALDFVVDHGLTNLCAVFSCNGHGQAAPVSKQQSASALAAKLKAFGWHVVEVDGHDPDEIGAAFDQFGKTERPLAIVARTVKGWGVPRMQRENYHGKTVPTADLGALIGELEETGRALGASGTLAPTIPVPSRSKPSASIGTSTPSLPSFEKACERAGVAATFAKGAMATRVAYGVALVALADADPRVVCLDADVSNSTFANMVEKAHRDRFVECRIAEQNMISVAAGLSAAGKVPFASSFAKFLARATDQIDMASISRANIKIAGSHSGVSLGADGPSQMSLSDVAYFRSMTRADNGRGVPACRVFVPSDAVSAYRLTELMARLDGMAFLRTHRPDAKFLYSETDRFEAGGCKQLRKGDRLTLVSQGYMLHTVLAAAQVLEQRGVGCNVFDAYTFPLDATPILDAARKAGGVILTVEDNYVGGLHSELAEAAAERGGVRVAGMTVRKIPKSAKTAFEVFTYVGVGEEQVVVKALELIGS